MFPLSSLKEDARDVDFFFAVGIGGRWVGFVMGG